MALNTYSDISSFVNDVYEDALTAVREQNLVINLIRTFGDQRGLAPRKIQQYGTASIASIAETDDLISQSYAPTALSTLTPAEVGGQIFLTDLRIETDPFGAREDASVELGNAMADKIETDVMSDFSSLTGGTTGADGSTMTWAYFFAALTILRNKKAPLPYAAVLHPYAWHDLATAVTPAAASATNAPNFQDEVMRRWWVQSIGPVDIFISSAVPVTSTNAVNALFSRDALALDTRRAPRLEPERDASRRGWELNMSGVYAHGVWRPTFGIQIKCDVTTPA